MASAEERREGPAKEMVHKTKTIQFLGRTTPIILQNDNGPCPLLAIYIHRNMILRVMNYVEFETIYRIGDFEFTRECAIFDLLDIPLYHGWIVDPQDWATAIAVKNIGLNKCRSFLSMTL
ncbi:unnamed protein product [Thlaspi arvense]|uniref:MINDY deubiquitinase domain-containing protein n=1 Tax=Thlaspi arvense TaxID=13288 RepID=A0AAU9S455_THLAR|nr:unnamed protein product [Thlaspi arvense]